MFLIARRYKKRKQSHRRSSSIMSPTQMRQSGSPALMGGAFMSGGRVSPGGTVTNDRNSRGSGRSAGNSARTQQISAPMMAENSLGWNWKLFFFEIRSAFFSRILYPSALDLTKIPHLSVQCHYHLRQVCFWRFERLRCSATNFSFLVISFHMALGSPLIYKPTPLSHH